SAAIARHAALRPAGVEGGAVAAEVGARAERAPRAGHDHRALAVVRADLVEHAQQLLEHLHVQRIQTVGPGERQREDAVLARGLEGLVAQGLLLPACWSLECAILPRRARAD